jgi:hypothetical protein
MKTIDLVSLLMAAEAEVELRWEKNTTGDRRRHLMRAAEMVRAARSEIEASVGGAEAFEREIWTESNGSVRDSHARELLARGPCRRVAGCAYWAGHDGLCGTADGAALAEKDG